MGEALVLKFPSCIWVSTADPKAGTTTFVHNWKTGPGRPRSTAALSTVMSVPVGLSRRIAPARKTVPPPRKLMDEFFSFQGSGKFADAEVLSAKPTETCKREVTVCSGKLKGADGFAGL